MLLAFAQLSQTEHEFPGSVFQIRKLLIGFFQLVGHAASSFGIEADPAEEPGVGNPARGQGAATFGQALDMRDSRPAEKLDRTT